MLGDDLWLRRFVVRFLGELVFSHGRMTVATEVAEIALAMVTRQIDLAPIVLAETYRALDRALWRCRHFYDCRALVQVKSCCLCHCSLSALFCSADFASKQVWLAAHMGVEILHPQRSAFDAYCRSGHSRIISCVHDVYNVLEGLTEVSVTWRIIPADAEPFAAFFNDSDMRLIVLLGLTGGVEYHPIRVMRQFGYCQDAFEQDPMPTFYQQYPLSSTAMTTELACMAHCCIYSNRIPMMKGSGYTSEYEAHMEETWPIREIPPGAPSFPGARSSTGPRSSSDV